MKKSFIIGFIFLLLSTTLANAGGVKKDRIIKNKYFSVTIPSNIKGYDYKREKDCIKIYDTDSKKAGFGGFAFAIKAYKNPKDHAVLPGSRKIGELTDKKGVIYDIIIKYPTDVQYDYTKSNEAPENYKSLYDLGEEVKVQGIKGSTYFPDRGMKGEDLYKAVLKKHLTAIKEDWDSERLEKEGMSHMYHVLRVGRKADISDKIGYVFYDVNADGIEELLIGEIAEGDWKGVIYDIYTMVDRKPKHVLSGWARNRFYVTDGTFLANEYSSGACDSGVRIYILVENSTEIFPQVAFKCDTYTNREKPWFISYGTSANEDKWENVTEETFLERKKIFETYERFDFIPFSKLKL